MAETSQIPLHVYVGTYNRASDDSIFHYLLDPSTGALNRVGAISGLDNPSFLTIHPNGKCLYAVSEVDQFSGQNAGGVSAFALDPQTGDPTILNQQSTIGSGPCYVIADASGRYVLVANYGSGSVCILPIGEDGGLEEASDFVQHQGSGADPNRQEKPHAHSIIMDPANRYAFASDLGLDKILIYRVDLENGKLIPNDPPGRTKDGAGPRHFVFHPNGRFAYVINELDNTVTAYLYRHETGSLEEIHTISTLPDDYTGTSHCADIHITPDGRFLYGSNRGHDSFAIFEIHPDTGQLTAIGYEPTGGKNPRNFALDPTGTYLLAANQDTNNIVTFRIDGQTGRLSRTGHEVQVNKPVCVQIVSAVS